MRPGDPAHGPTAPDLPADSGASPWPGHSPTQASFCVLAEPVQRSAVPGRGDRIRAGGPLRPEAKVGCGHAAIRLGQRWSERAGTCADVPARAGALPCRSASHSFRRGVVAGGAGPDSSWRSRRPRCPVTAGHGAASAGRADVCWSSAHESGQGDERVAAVRRSGRQTQSAGWPISSAPARPICAGWSPPPPGGPAVSRIQVRATPG